MTFNCKAKVVPTGLVAPLLVVGGVFAVNYVASGDDNAEMRRRTRERSSGVSRTSRVNAELGETKDRSASNAAIAQYAEYRKPSDRLLRRQLSEMNYWVTQREGTEPAFNNPLWNNKQPGIYVDILSGEPLFSSLNKYESGTGWPSFTKPLEPELLVLKKDRKMSVTRTEVRSRFGDNHLGHVFGDGPTTLWASGGAEPTGLRWCMNSAALRFIHKDSLMEQGYEEYVQLFEEK